MCPASGNRRRRHRSKMDIIPVRVSMHLQSITIPCPWTCSLICAPHLLPPNTHHLSGILSRWNKQVVCDDRPTIFLINNRSWSFCHALSIAQLTIRPHHQIGQGRHSEDQVEAIGRFILKYPSTFTLLLPFQDFPKSFNNLPSRFSIKETPRILVNSPLTDMRGSVDMA